MKQNKLNWLGALLLLLPVSVFALPTAKITIHAVDTDGEPVSGAKAVLVLDTPYAPGEGWGWNSYSVKGETDEKGYVTLRGAGSPRIGYSVKADGYYDSGYEMTFKSVSGIPPFRRYKPWNPTLEVVLKKIRNPIP